MVPETEPKAFSHKGFESVPGTDLKVLALLTSFSVPGTACQKKTTVLKAVVTKSYVLSYKNQKSVLCFCPLYDIEFFIKHFDDGGI